MKKLLLLCAVVLTLASCQTQQSAINDLRTLSQELQINGDNYSINDWKQAGKRYYDINKKISKHAGDYTDEQLEEISRLNGKCARSFTEGAVTKVQGAVSAIASFLEGFMK